MRNKVKNLKNIIGIVKRAKKDGKKIVTTNGCFDLMHPGHIATLEWAKMHGDIFIVGINSDKSIKKVIGKDRRRPIIAEKDRALTLAGLSAVDYVFIFNEKVAAPWLLKIKPHIHVKGKGSEKHPAFLADVTAVKVGGGRVLLAPKMKNYSSTNIINRILKKYKK